MTWSRSRYAGCGRGFIHGVEEDIHFSLHVCAWVRDVVTHGTTSRSGHVIIPMSLCSYQYVLSYLYVFSYRMCSQYTGSISCVLFQNVFSIHICSLTECVLNTLEVSHHCKEAPRMCSLARVLLLNCVLLLECVLTLAGMSSFQKGSWTQPCAWCCWRYTHATRMCSLTWMFSY